MIHGLVDATVTCKQSLQSRQSSLVVGSLDTRFTAADSWQGGSESNTSMTAAWFSAMRQHDITALAVCDQSKQSNKLWIKVFFKKVFQSVFLDYSKYGPVNHAKVAT